MLNWFKKKPAPMETGPGRKRADSPIHDVEVGGPFGRIDVQTVLADLHAKLPRGKAGGTAMDDCDGGEFADPYADDQPNLSGAIVGFFLRQGFIGHQLAGLLAQNWLINKCCTMPGRDAVRKGFEINTPDGDDERGREVVRLLRAEDKRMRLRQNCEEFIRFGRIFGVRLAYFKVDSTDPDYYVNPFNVDGIEPGSYKGIVQIDPYWIAPELDAAASSDPGSMHFYEPTYWVINGQRYHRSHLVIYRHAPPIDVLKPAYMYGGVPVPQLILERIYAAERSANEAPELLMTKRSTFLKLDTSKAYAQGGEIFKSLSRWVRFRNNYGVKVMGLDDEAQQVDTSLADLDAVIMTQYQLVAAAANVPATKLLGTTPKGFNATGAYEESSYHEELESVQVNDLTPLVERHHLLLMYSEVLPKMRRVDADFHAIATEISWNPLDSMTAKEAAEVRKIDAETGKVLIDAGAIDEYDERERVIATRDSPYAGMARAERPPEADEDGEAGIVEGGRQDASNA